MNTLSKRRVFKSRSRDTWTVLSYQPLDVDDNPAHVFRAAPFAYFYDRGSWSEAMEVALNVPFKPGRPWKPAPTIESTGV